MLVIQAAFTCEDEMLAKYSHELEEPLRLARKNAFLSGLTFGFGMGSTFMIYALVFWWVFHSVLQYDTQSKV